MGREHDHSLHEELAASRLAEIDQRLTSARRDALAILTGAGRPLTVDEILAAAPNLSQSSLYRNLAVFELAGLVVRVQSSDDKARYELSEALAGHHHHMVCARCGAVADVHVPDSLENEIDRVLGALAKKAGFTLDHHRLDAVGVCSQCQESST
jgi:Fe2+ or Zn2+ uptake regulation protein